MAHPRPHRVRELRRRAARAGFTLIELLIALALAAFTIAGLYQLFTTQSRQLLMQDQQMELHQSMRFAADMVSRSVRIAGYGSPAEVRGVFGYPSDAETLPAIVSYDADGANGTDAISVFYADPGLTVDTRSDENEPCSGTELYFRPGMLDHSARLAEIEADQLFTCFDYADISGMNAWLWSVTADADYTNGVVYVSDGTSYADYANECTDNLSPVMTCSKAHVMTFYVDDQDDGIGAGSSSSPTLMLDLDQDWPEDDDVPLVNNVEDFQVEYCMDDGTGTIDCSDSGNWADSFTYSDIENLWMVRLSFIVRSDRQEFSDRYKNVRPALGNRSAASSSDGYYRQVLTTEVTVRNIRHQATLSL